MALKGRVHRTEGGRGGTDDTPGSEIETYEELVHFEVDLIRPVFGFEGEEEEPERQTLSGNSSEEYGQMQEQWEAEGWEIEELEGVKNPRPEYEEVEIQTSGSEGEYGNPYGSPLEVRGLRSGSGHDIVLIETLAEEDEIRQLYEQIEETPEDRYRIYWNGSIADMGFTTEQWSRGERITFGEDPYHPAPVMSSSAHFTTDTGVSPTVSWSEYWFQAEKEIPEGKSATKTFLIHATQLERNSDPDAPPLTAEQVDANREEWFGTVTFKIKEKEKISTEAPEVEWNGSPPCANWVEAKSDGTLLVKPPANRNDQEGEENVVVLLPVEVVELAPKLRDFETGDEIEGSELPDPAAENTNPMVEVNPVQDRIAHRDIKIKIGDGSTLEGKKVTWNMEALFTPPDSGGRVFRGEWTDSQTHPNRFEASTEFDTYGFQSMSQVQGQTEIDAEGFTAIRANLPPIGFNKARIKIQIEGSSDFIELIDMEVPAIVVIDPGHGGDTSVSGSSWNNATSPSGVLEKNMTLDYARALRDSINNYAEENDLLVSVAMTRDSDRNLTGQERANIARDLGADIFQSFHFNAANGTARGSESLIRGNSNVNEDEDEALGRRVLDGVLEALGEYDAEGISDRGVKNYGWSASQGQNVPSSWAVLADGSYGNVEEYAPVRGNILEVEFIDVEAVDELLNTGENAEAVRDSVGEDVRDAIIEDINHQP